MSNLSVQSNPQAQQVQAVRPCPSPTIQETAQKVQTSETQGLAKDLNETRSLKRGLVPTLKGAGAGLVGGAAAVALPVGLFTVAVTSSSRDGAGVLVAGVVGIAAAAIGGATGTLAGAVAANTTDSKGKGALLGAGLGAVAGAAAMGIKGKGNVAGMVLGGVAGAIAGAGGGYAGSMVAKVQ